MVLCIFMVRYCVSLAGGGGGHWGISCERHVPNRLQVRLFGRNGCEAHAIAVKIVHPDDPQNVLATIRAKVGE